MNIGLNLPKNIINDPNYWIEPLKEDHSQGRTRLQHLEANFAYW